MLNDLDVLEAAVEGVRLDVVERRCHVVDQEVEGLSSAVQSAGRALQDLKGEGRHADYAEQLYCVE